MGYLTTITIYNDALHVFEEHPKEFAEAIFDGIKTANRNRTAATVPFFNHGNYMEVQSSRHADDFTVYVHTGNCVSNLNWYDEEFKSFAQSSPKIAERFVDDAIAHLKKIKANFKKT